MPRAFSSFVFEALSTCTSTSCTILMQHIKEKADRCVFAFFLSLSIKVQRPNVSLWIKCDLTSTICCDNPHDCNPKKNIKSYHSPPHPAQSLVPQPQKYRNFGQRLYTFLATFIFRMHDLRLSISLTCQNVIAAPKCSESVDMFLANDSSTKPRSNGVFFVLEIESWLKEWLKVQVVQVLCAWAKGEKLVPFGCVKLAAPSLMLSRVSTLQSQSAYRQRPKEPPSLPLLRPAYRPVTIVLPLPSTPYQGLLLPCQ